MKKITFLALLLAGSLNAQTYCSIGNNFFDIEEITSVNMVTTTITNSDASTVYINKVATVVNVSQGDSYTLTVKGNTYGAFDNEYVAFVDWNHNGTLDNTGEVFYIGLIFSSTGTDSKSASTSIPVPADALVGNTRIRILKVYTDQEFGDVLNYDPCSVSSYNEIFEEIEESYGQVLDFTLNVSTLNRDTFDNTAFVIYPNPVSDVLNIHSNETIDLVSIYNLQGQLVLENKNAETINVQSLASGHYFLKISAGNLSQVKKFVKN